MPPRLGFMKLLTVILRLLKRLNPLTPTTAPPRYRIIRDGNNLIFVQEFRIDCGYINLRTCHTLAEAESALGGLVELDARRARSEKITVLRTS